MKSCLSLFFVLLVLTTVVGTCALLFYLSTTASFSRKAPASAAKPAATRAAPAAPADANPLRPSIPRPAPSPIPGR